jgi:hypothetical protein
VLYAFFVERLQRLVRSKHLDVVRREFLPLVVKRDVCERRSIGVTQRLRIRRQRPGSSDQGDIGGGAA